MKRMAQKAGASHSGFMARRRARKEAESRLEGYKSPLADLTAEQLRAIIESDAPEGCGVVGRPKPGCEYPECVYPKCSCAKSPADRNTGGA